MKERLLVFLCVSIFAACVKAKDPCEELRIGMKKSDVERIVGRPDSIRISNARTVPADLYLDVSIHTYANKGPFAEPDVLFIANREDELINIRCADKPIRLHVDGTYVDELYIHRWRIDKNPPANKKVTPPQ